MRRQVVLLGILALVLADGAPTNAARPLALWYRIEYSVAASIVQKSGTTEFERTTSYVADSDHAVLLRRIGWNDFSFRAGTFGRVVAHHGLEKRLTDGVLRDCLGVYRETARDEFFQGSVGSTSIRAEGISQEISVGGLVTRRGTVTCAEKCTFDGCTGRRTVKHADPRTVTPQIGWPIPLQLRFRQGGFGQRTIQFSRSGIRGPQGQTWDFDITFTRCRDQDLERNCQ
jgi:hypothetical protein